VNKESKPKLLDYQQRVIDEKNKLDEKVKRLTQFVGTKPFNELPNTDQYLLKRQREVMLEYASILQSRIERFDGQSRSR
jgi:hypothetical protein